MITRSFKLRVYPNFHKMEALRYSASRYGQYLQSVINYLYFRPWLRSASTAGLGKLANQARHEAQGILRAGRESAKETGAILDRPEVKYTSCPARIERSKGSSFDFWVKVTSSFPLRKEKPVCIPAKSYETLNRRLRNNWELSEYCKLQQDRRGRWFAYVYLSKELQAPVEQPRKLGVDVGWVHSVTRSDGYLGHSSKKIAHKERDSQRERSRQGHERRSVKTILKQRLDIEVKRAVARCLRTSSSLVVEDPKVLANLRGHGALGRWAKTYFASRATDYGHEVGVHVRFVNPGWTSTTCSVCGKQDKRSRVSQSTFKCSACESRVHADINAARNIALKGSMVQPC